MLKSLNALLFSFFVLAGCAAAPPTPGPAEIAAANIGPSPANYEQLIKGYFSQRLVDPASAMYGTMTPPQRGSLRPLLAGGTSTAPIIGYVVCGTLNSKNRMGGYAGAKPFAVVIVNGAIAYAELPTIQC